MIVESAYESPQAKLEQWFRSPVGGEVVRAECACVQRLLANTFGYYLLQVGATESFGEALAASRIRYRIRVPDAHSSASAGATLVASPSCLPVASDSVDAVLLPHTLELAMDPRGVVAEVERVLIPEGRVIVVGFNPASTWGLRRLMSRAKGAAPWCGRFRLASQVEGWLAGLGFDVEVRERLIFCPPLLSTLGRRCRGVDALGRRLAPALGAVYVIRAVKRVATLTPLKPLRANPGAILTGRAVRPTTRGTGHV